MEGKNPVTVERTRKGGLRGGNARAEKLTPEQRSEIARIAANARWRNVSSDSAYKLLLPNLFPVFQRD
uniref:Uncharacterized protein n=1 Tax=Candidatus Kentrum eta TaxID=2126337 RepID=A0A450V609_9GAMM|nr:MAG: hypothetical protein BECKH772B_GA0070898_101834 [Candidatus Kentron sp. H]VFK00316.1 MAG: hypothetical protein BECKH772A_GA0070896_101894 [Candidatus Kentron sp. H]VFK04433.1 MAG: hypothetical protein BECKH772C_GA0070978_101814 [Candidatus Kentron sp. H]